VTHPEVPHPQKLTKALSLHDRTLSWLSAHILASRVMFDAALVLPLLVLPMSTGAKVTLGVISGSWIQWWALPALQRSQMEADQKRDAKANADHQALTHIAHIVDAIHQAVKEGGQDA
jgi:hypothetical protein